MSVFGLNIKKKNPLTIFSLCPDLIKTLNLRSKDVKIYNLPQQSQITVEYTEEIDVLVKSVITAEGPTGIVIPVGPSLFASE